MSPRRLQNIITKNSGKPMSLLVTMASSIRVVRPLSFCPCTYVSASAPATKPYFRLPQSTIFLRFSCSRYCLSLSRNSITGLSGPGVRVRASGAACGRGATQQSPCESHLLKKECRRGVASLYYAPHLCFLSAPMRGFPLPFHGRLRGV